MTADDGSILFILGGARSGTTYVNRIIDNWFDYGMGPEGAFVAEFYAKRDRYGDLNVDANLDRLISDLSECRMLQIMREKWAEEFRVDVTTDMIRAALSKRTFAGVIYALFAAVATAQKKSRVGNKWPEYWRHLPMLDEMFGSRARYLFVLRDGRDVALSTMKMAWGEKTSYACARNWAACVNAVDEFAAAHPQARVATVCYERILADPASAWQELEMFLGCTPDAQRQAAFVKSVEDNPMRNNTSKWRSEMSIREQRVFEAVAGPSLTRHGYELAHDEPRLSAAAHAWFAAAEVARKVYWTVRSKLSQPR